MSQWAWDPSPPFRKTPTGLASWILAVDGAWEGQDPTRRVGSPAPGRRGSEHPPWCPRVPQEPPTGASSLSDDQAHRGHGHMGFISAPLSLSSLSPPQGPLRKVHPSWHCPLSLHVGSPSKHRWMLQKAKERGAGEGRGWDVAPAPEGPLDSAPQHTSILSLSDGLWGLLLVPSWIQGHSCPPGGFLWGCRGSAQGHSSGDCRNLSPQPDCPAPQTLTPSPDPLLRAEAHLCRGWGWGGEDWGRVPRQLPRCRIHPFGQRAGAWELRGLSLAGN